MRVQHSSPETGRGPSKVGQDGARSTDGPSQVSIVIPTHNEGQWLQRTVDAVFTNTRHERFEVIIVDDGSTDGSCRFLDTDPYRRQPVKLVVGNALGVAGARNRGAEVARGDILVFLDAHVLPDPGWLCELADLLSDASVGLAGLSVRSITDPGTKGYTMVITGPDLSLDWSGPPSDVPFESPCIVGLCAATRRDLFAEMGGFDPGSTRWGYEDLELSIRTWLLGYRCVVSPRVEVAHLFKSSPQRDFEVTWEDIDVNLLRAILTLFGERRAARVIDQIKSRQHFSASLWRVLGDPAFWARREDLRSRFVRDDDWYFARFAHLMGDLAPLNSSAAEGSVGKKTLARCVNCSAELGPDDRFCGQCGHPVAVPADAGITDLYDSAYFDFVESNSIPSAPAIAEIIFKEFKPSSVVDVGCGTAVYLEQLQSRGVEVLGVENAQAALERSRVGRDLVIQHDLRQPLHLDRRFDLALSFEVAEHLEPQYAERFVESLCSLSDRVLFTAAVPGQGGVWHVNEQPWEYWISLFWQYGYELDAVRTARLRYESAQAEGPYWLRYNLAVFQRPPHSREFLAHSLRLVEHIEGWLSPAEIQFLFSAARQTPGATAVVEIGSWKGRSTAALGLGALTGAAAPVFAVDHHRGSVDIAEWLGVPLAEIKSWPEFHANLQELGLDYAVTPVLKDALAAEATWDGPPINLLLIDGAHDYEGVWSDFAAWSRHVRPGGIIAFHDTTTHEGPRRVVEEIFADGQLLCPVTVDSITYGLAPETMPRPAGEKWSFPPLPRQRERHDRISLIMPTRNEGDNLQKTIDSLLENTFYPDFEVLILDDASDDGSCDFLCTPPYSDDERLRLIRTDSHKHHLALRIEGAQLATGSVFQFLDSHHWFSPYWLTNLYDSLCRRDFRALVGPVVCALDPSSWQPTAAISYGWGACATFDKTWHLTEDQVGPDGRVAFLVGHQIMVSRRVYETIGGLCPFFQSHGPDDLDFCIRASLFGYDCYVERSAVIAHLYKDHFVSPPRWQDSMCNYYILDYLNFGGDKLEEIKAGHGNEYDYAEALELFETLRPEIEEFRGWILKHQRRTVEEVVAQMSRVEPQVPSAAD